MRRVKPTSRSKICSDHFLEKHLNRSSIGGKTILRQGAVPTRFKKFPQHLKKKVIERRPIVRIDTPSASQSTNSITISTEQEELAPPDLPSQVSCPTSLPTIGCSNETDSPRSLKKKLHQRDVQLTNVRKCLKTTQQRSQRLKQKVLTLESLMKELREKDLLSQNGEEMLEKSFLQNPRLYSDEVSIVEFREKAASILLS